MPLGSFVKAQKWKYNDIELEEANGFNIYEMDWRQYDPTIGRWLTIDPIVHYSLSTYNAFDNNPVFWADPSGTDAIVYKDGVEFDGADAGKAYAAYISAMDTGEGTFDLDGKFFDVTSTEELPQVSITGYRTPWNSIGLGKLKTYLEGHVYANANVYAYLRSERRWNNAHEALDMVGLVPVVGEAFDAINAGLYAYRGNYTMAALSAAAIVPVAGTAATGFKVIQKHHIIPKAVYRNLGDELSSVMMLNAGNNLKKLPVGFHGNHPQYNTYVQNQINNLSAGGNLSPGSIQVLQGNLSSMINQAYDSYKFGGGNLNEYFRVLNQ